MKEEKIFFSGGQDLCVWNEKGELLDKRDRASEHCKYKANWILKCYLSFLVNEQCHCFVQLWPVIYIIIIISAI